MEFDRGNCVCKAFVNQHTSVHVYKYISIYMYNVYVCIWQKRRIFTHGVLAIAC